MKGLKKLVNVTLAAVYVLILVGATVRSTGAGMGCPDWPKCFGKWVPPVSMAGLPENYKQVYAAYREKKNQRFADFLESIGMKTTAHQLRTDESIRKEADFNAVKTWTEYVNRVIGMVTGLLVVAVFVRSLVHGSVQLMWLASLALAVILITGWFGSIVVSTNLTPWTVTLHMLLAFALLALLVQMQVKLSNPPAHAAGNLLVWMGVACLVTVVQVVLGTQVRESVDMLAQSGMNRDTWIDKLGAPFLVHRSFSWVALGVNAFIVWKLYTQKPWRRWAMLLGALVVFPVLTGALMAWFAVPAFLQPVHLLLAALLFGLQWHIWQQMQYASTTVKTHVA
ncbi:MAG: hypothetical protein KatS3mg032_0510 [Cyclobacteriaceae bacterium]|nr:MAG: hypothetical protein KatS3mg032_0510 [Cyclobacteriaceae bacterium]